MKRQRQVDGVDNQGQNGVQFPDPVVPFEVFQVDVRHDQNNQVCLVNVLVYLVGQLLSSLS